MLVALQTALSIPAKHTHAVRTMADGRFASGPVVIETSVAMIVKFHSSDGKDSPAFKDCNHTTGSREGQGQCRESYLIRDEMGDRETSLASVSSCHEGGEERGNSP